MLKKLILLVGILTFIPLANASLAVNFQFNGRGNWSIDAIGSTTSNVGDLRALVPTGSTIEAAFLYQTTQNNTTAQTVTFGGVVISGTDWTSLGTVTNFLLTGFRADVTAQIASSVAGGNDTIPFTFSVVEANTAASEGEALVVVYSNPSENERTIALLDGFTEPAGDTTSINLQTALTAAQLANADFEAQLSLGIGFGFQGSQQASNVDVNGVRLTSSAGGQDDGIASNGGLITVGDTFDDDFLTNTSNALAGPNGNTRFDDEAYNLIPLLNAGDTVIRIDTNNPSFDDNIFFAGLNITAIAGVNAPPPPLSSNVPEPGSFILIGIGLLGFVCRKRRAI